MLREMERSSGAGERLGSRVSPTKGVGYPADLSGMRRTTAIALVSVALVSTAAVVGAYFVTHKTEPSQGKDLQQRAP